MVMSGKWLNWTVLPLLALAFTAAAPQDYKYLEKLETPYVPTNQPTVDAMLRIANVGPNDVVIDLGSGDGRILIAAAKYRGARGFGVDLDPALVTESLDHAKAAGVSDRVHFYRRDLFETKISEATVVTMYLLPHINLQLRPRLFAELKPGTRVVSHDYHMGEWKADIEATVRGYGSKIYFWIIPAQVGGTWALQTGAQQYEVQFQQHFQEIEGSAVMAGRPSHVRDARLEGDRIWFRLIDDADYSHVQRFEGRVNGNIIEGTVRGEGVAPAEQYTWRATRKTS
jgi:SAM-dependent methyltransferase